MKKMFLAATLAATICVPAYANYSNSGDGVYNAPDYDRVVNEAQVVEPTEKEKNMNKSLPISFTGDKAEYDSVSGDFYLSGNVVITQGREKLVTNYAQGNMKTGDVWLEQGGSIVEPGSTLSGKWAHYNFNTKTGEIKEVGGTGDKDWYTAPHATIHPDKMVMDQGGTMSRCPAVEHTPCLSVTAKTFEIYPKQKMVAKDVQVFVKGKHVLSKDIWERDLTETNKTRIIPRIGYDGSDNGAFIKIDAVVLQRVDQHFHSAGNLTLGIGVLHTEEQHAAALMAHTFGNGALHQVAEMYKTSGRGGHTGNHSAFRQLTGREAGFHFLGSLGHMGEQQFR